MRRLARRLVVPFATMSAALLMLTIAAPAAFAGNRNIITWHVKGGELRPGIDRSMCLDHGSTQFTGQVPALKSCDGSADQKWWIDTVTYRDNSPLTPPSATHILTGWWADGDDFMYYTADPRQPFLISADDLKSGDYESNSWKVVYTDYTPFMMLKVDDYRYDLCLSFGGRDQAPRWTSPCQQENNSVLVSGI